ncbi:MAG: DegT/DnrJ/EryC1/StrS family aminotransferase [Candidatus Woesearchaeota archaeon]
MIPLFRPSYSDEEISAVVSVIKSGWWGSGPEVTKFEKEFSSFIGTSEAVALNSGTASLHLAGKVLNLPKGSEVITTPLTFISTAFLADYNNLKIVFADIEEDTLNIDPDDIKRKITRKTKVIVPVHYGGHSCRMDEIMEIAKENNLFVIEDCAHASGASYKGKKLGSIGDIGCFSFQAVKNIATGDGGMITTNNKEWAENVRVLRWVGITRDTSQRTEREQYNWEYEIREVGYKFQMTDIAAALGRVQLKRLPQNNRIRRQITEFYNQQFASLKWLKTPKQQPYADSSNHNYCIRVNVGTPEENEKIRNNLILHLKKKRIHSSVHYKPVYLQKVYNHIKVDCPVTDKVWKSLLLLPIFPDMSEEEMFAVTDAVKSFMD